MVCFLTPSVFAQSGNLSEISSGDLSISYDRIGVLYSNTRLWSDKENDIVVVDGKKNISLNGFGIEYIHGFNLKKNLPLFLEIGAKLDFAIGAQAVDEITSRSKTLRMEMHKMYIAVPLNLAYTAYVGKNVSLMPYMGLQCKINILAQSRTFSVPEIVMGADGVPILPSIYGDIVSKWESLYPGDGKSMFGEKYHYQVGWHVGVGVEYRRIYIGINYGTDFTKAFKDVNEGEFTTTLGYTF